MDVRRTTFGVALAGAAVAALVLGCREDLLAPATGTCPDFCPPEQLQVVDSILLDNVVSDSSFAGYVLPYQAGNLQVYRDSSAGGEAGSRAILSFPQFADTLLLGATDTTYGSVVATDSFAVEIPVRGRNLGVTGLELAVYRIPAGVDSFTTYSDLDPYFTDSTLLGTVAVPDTLVSGNLTLQLDSLAFPGFAADGNRAAVGVALRATNSYVQLGSYEGAAGAVLTRYVQLDSAGTVVPRQQGKLPLFDSFVATTPPASPASARAIGGTPSSRTMLRFTLPPRIVDSSTVVRATLLLLPAEPVYGPPGDSLAVIVQGLAADVGAKSPLRSVSPDSVPLLLAFLPVGSTDTIRLDVTDLVIGWTTDGTRPRTFALRAVPEGNSVAELRIGSAASGALRPRLQVTFIPPLRLGER